VRPRHSSDEFPIDEKACIRIESAYEKCIQHVLPTGSVVDAMKKTDLHDILRTRILDLSLAPGSALEEGSLCDAYGVSRTPLREVLQRLAGEGLVTLEANRGAAVASMDLPVIRSLMQTAPMIYAAVARMAAEHATPGSIDVLKDAQRRFRAASGDAAAMAMQNHRFHEGIGTMAANPYLMPSLRRLLIDHTRMSRRFYDGRTATQREAIREACDQHDAMIAAFEDRAPARVVGLTLDHWALSRDGFERFVTPDPLPLDPTQEIRDAV